MLNLRPKKWDATGRTFEVLDDQNMPTGKLVWKGGIGQHHIQDSQGNWQPYIYDGNELKYADNMGIEFASGQQVIKQGANKLCRSMKFFVQQETSPDVWQTISHGMPSRQMRHNKRFRKGQLIDDDGACLGWLSFPDAPYDLQLGLQAKRNNKAVFGFRFRASVSGRVRFQIVKDGIEPRQGGYSLIKMGGGFKGREERTVGVKYKNFEWRWTYEEALLRTVTVEDSTNHAGEKKGIITIGPFDYTANDWVEVLPDTFGSSEADDDGFDFGGSNFYGSYNDMVYVGKYDGGQADNMGLTWENVTVPAGATANDGCNLYVYVRDATAGTTGHCKAYTVDNRAITTWSGSYYPVNAPRHATALTWTDWGDGYVNSFYTTPEIKTIIQDRLDDDHQSGDEIGIVLIDNASSNGHFTGIDCQESGLNPGAVLTIVYTPLASTFTPRRIMWSQLFLNPVFFFVSIFAIGCMKNTKLNRRNFLNPFEWFG